MEKEDARKQSREVLQERRKQVIRLHRKGVGVMQIVEQTGLSWSGVNAALRLFEQGGAAALKPPPWECQNFCVRGTLNLHGSREAG